MPKTDGTPTRGERRAARRAALAYAAGGLETPAHGEITYKTTHLPEWQLDIEEIVLPSDPARPALTEVVERDGKRRRVCWQCGKLVGLKGARLAAHKRPSDAPRNYNGVSAYPNACEASRAEAGFVTLDIRSRHEEKVRAKYDESAPGRTEARRQKHLNERARGMPMEVRAMLLAAYADRTDTPRWCVD